MQAHHVAAASCKNPYLYIAIQINEPYDLHACSHVHGIWVWMDG